VSGEEDNLKSWVRTLNEVEGMTLLDLARPGLRLSLWRQEADNALTQADANYRSLLIKMVERMLLDHDEERILDSRYLANFQAGWPQLRMELFLIRYGITHPWTALAGRELLQPALQAAQEAGQEAKVTLKDFDTFVDKHIDPAIGPSSRKKTRSTIVGLFKKLGVLSSAGSRSPLMIHQTTPSPLAFGWAVAHELSTLDTPLVTEQWAATSSAAAAVFLPPREYAQRCLEAAVSDQMIMRPPLAVGLQLAS
jgi:hypothetical protein